MILSNLLFEILNDRPGIFAKVCFCVLVKREEGLSALAVGYARKRYHILAGWQYSVLQNGGNHRVGDALRLLRPREISRLEALVDPYDELGHKVIGSADAAVCARGETREKHLVGAVVEYLFGIGVYEAIRITVVIRTRPKALSYSAFGGVRP